MQRRGGDEGAAADLAAQVALVDEALVRTGDGFRGDAQARGEASDGRQAIAGSEGAGLDAAAELVDELLAEGVTAAGGAIKGEFEGLRSGVLYGVSGDLSVHASRRRSQNSELRNRLTSDV